MVNGVHYILFSCFNDWLYHGCECDAGECLRGLLPVDGHDKQAFPPDCVVTFEFMLDIRQK